MRGYCTRGRLLSSGCSRQISIVHGNGPTCKVRFGRRTLPAPGAAGRQPGCGAGAGDGRRRDGQFLPSAALKGPLLQALISTLSVFLTGEIWRLCAEPGQRSLTGTKAVSTAPVEWAPTKTGQARSCGMPDPLRFPPEEQSQRLNRSRGSLGL